MIAEKFKITPAEANGTYETLLSMFNKDGRLPPKVARGYLEILRQERPIPAAVVQNFTSRVRIHRTGFNLPSSSPHFACSFFRSSTLNTLVLAN